MEILAFLRRLHNESVKLAASLQPRTDQRIAACIHFRLVELVGAFLVLADHRLGTAAPVVLRSMLESFADLRNVLDDPNYSERMKATVADRWRKLHRRVRDEWRGPLEQYQAQLRGLADENAKPLNVRDRLELASLPQEYGSVYGRLCAEGHGDLGTLVRRHIREEDGRVRVILYRAPDEWDVRSQADTAAGILLSSTEIIHAQLPGGQPDRLPGFGAELERIRASYPS